MSIFVRDFTEFSISDFSWCLKECFWASQFSMLIFLKIFVWLLTILKFCFFAVEYLLNKVNCFEKEKKRKKNTRLMH